MWRDPDDKDARRIDALAVALTEQLLEQRVRAGYSCETIAKACGLATSTIYGMERRRGCGGTQLETLLRYCDGLGLELRVAKKRKKPQ